jgi:hypothetical protein
MYGRNVKMSQEILPSTASGYFLQSETQHTRRLSFYRFSLFLFRSTHPPRWNPEDKQDGPSSRTSSSADCRRFLSHSTPLKYLIDTGSNFDFSVDGNSLAWQFIVLDCQRNEEAWHQTLIQRLQTVPIPESQPREKRK